MAFIKDRLKTIVLKLLDDPQVQAKAADFVRKVVKTNAKEILEAVIYDKKFPQGPYSKP